MFERRHTGYRIRMTQHLTASRVTWRERLRQRAATAAQEAEIPAQESYDYHRLTAAEIAPLTPRLQVHSSALARLLALLNGF
jgi:hypothetical protein